jgi:hypothetical protein
VFRSELLRDSSFSELLFRCGSSRPHSLMRSRSAGPGAQIIAFETQAQKLADLRVITNDLLGRPGTAQKREKKSLFDL